MDKIERLLSFLSMYNHKSRFQTIFIIISKKGLVHLKMSSEEEQMEPLYEVESIISKRFTSEGKPQYLIKWKGYSQKTWEPIQHLSEIPDMIFQFEEREKEERKKKKSIPRATKTPLKSESYPMDRQTPKKETKDNKLKQKVRKVGQKKRMLIQSQQQQSLSLQQEHKQKTRTNKPVIAVENVESQPESEPDRRTLKLTQINDHEPYVVYEQANRKGDIFHDVVKKIHQIKRFNGKWMVEVQFESNRFERSWEERDMIRMLYPVQLLAFYEQLAKEKKNQTY